MSGSWCHHRGPMEGTPHLGFGMGFLFILSLLSGSNRVRDLWVVQILMHSRRATIHSSQNEECFLWPSDHVYKSDLSHLRELQPFLGHPAPSGWCWDWLRAHVVWTGDYMASSEGCWGRMSVLCSTLCHGANGNSSCPWFICSGFSSNAFLRRIMVK